MFFLLCVSFGGGRLHLVYSMRLKSKSMTIHEIFGIYVDIGLYQYFSISIVMKTVCDFCLEYVATYIYLTFTWSNWLWDSFLFVRMKD